MHPSASPHRLIFKSKLSNCIHCRRMSDWRRTRWLRFFWARLDYLRHVAYSRMWYRAFSWFCLILAKKEKCSISSCNRPTRTWRNTKSMKTPNKRSENILSSSIKCRSRAMKKQKTKFLVICTKISLTKWKNKCMIESIENLVCWPNTSQKRASRNWSANCTKLNSYLDRWYTILWGQRRSSTQVCILWTWELVSSSVRYSDIHTY